MRLRKIVILAVAIAAVPGAATANAAVAPLTGETLTSGIGSTSTSTFCDGSQPVNYTETYDAVGAATGPYPFTIVSGTTTITGTKTLTTGGTGVCGLTGTVLWNATASYTATITDPSGTTTDSGVSQVQGGSAFLTETFVSTAPAPVCDPNEEGDEDQGGDSQGC